MSINPLRKTLHRIGLDIHRYHPSPNRLEWLKNLDIQTVFDIGANIGQFAQEIRSILPNTHIYSFEPIRDCFVALKKDLEDDHRFTAFNYAIGEMEEISTINRNAYSPSSSILTMAESHKQFFPHTKNSHTEKIMIKTLDAVMSEIKAKKNLLIKVDTQGYEDKILSGGQKAFSEAVAVIMEVSFETLYEDQPLFHDIYEKLRAFGFHYRGAAHEKIHPKTGAIIFEDAIFVR